MNRAQRRKAEMAIRRLVTDRCSHHLTEETDAVVERCLAGLSEIVRAAGVSSEIWLNVQSSPWKRDDAEWFKAHPQRAHRVRDRFPYERFNGEPSDLPNVVISKIIVRQIRAGLRVRAAFIVKECSEPDAPVVLLWRIYPMGASSVPVSSAISRFSCSASELRWAISAVMASI